MCKHLFLVSAAILLTAWFAPVFSQSISISYQNPDQLVVCSADTLEITLLNNTAQPIPAAQLDLELPLGLEYRPATVAGAAELDLSDPAKPVFAAGDLTPGVPVQIRLQLYASCELVAAINSAQLFSVLLRARSGGISEQVITTKFQIQTSLLVITQVDNDSVAGEKGDMFIRTWHVRNTRLGAVQHLFIRDLHKNGIALDVDDAQILKNDSIELNAYFGGDFFKNFGDGDSLLEFNEVVLIRQKITIADCGFPAFLNRSTLIAEWSCAPDQAPCQGDSTRAEVMILPSTYQPELLFKPRFALPWDHCAELPHEMSLRVVNAGNAPATNVILEFRSQLPGVLGMDKGSFRIHYSDGSVQTIVPNLAEEAPMGDCGVTQSGKITLYLAQVDVQDTLDIRFDGYYCNAPCSQVLPAIRMNYFYNKPCPENSFIVADTVVFGGNLGDRLNGFATFSIGQCLEDGQTYPLHYNFRSARLRSDSGYVALQLDLPEGLFWNDSCPALLDGKSPVRQTIEQMHTGYKFTQVTLAWPLPLSSDSAILDFCLKNICSDSNAMTYLGNGYPGPDKNFEIYVPDACESYGFRIYSRAMLMLDPFGDVDCAVQACDSSDLRTNCPCPSCVVPPLSGPPLPGEPPCFKTKEYHEAYRLNYDYADNDDDRRADPGGVLDLEKVRRDRFLPGDTIRNIFATKILCGDSIDGLFYQLYTEVLAADYGYAGANDTFPIGVAGNVARNVFTAKDLFSMAGAALTIWDSSANTVYTCSIADFPTGDEKLYGIVAPVNNKPLVGIDEFTTMNYPFIPNMDSLAAAGCVPPGFRLQAGDSVRLRVDLKLGFNFTPYVENQHYPPLCNFEMGYRANRGYRFYNYRNADTLMFQYSGYVDSLTTNTFGIRPCTKSTQITPFSYNIRIARENLFPYEVRPLDRIVFYQTTMPAELVPITATLQFLRLQESSSFLTNVPLPYYVAQDTFLRLDFSPAYQEPVDEGYGLRTLIEFAPACGFTAPDSSEQQVLLDFPGCMSMPDSVWRYLKNKIGYYSNAPRDTITTDEPVLDFPSPVINADVTVRNMAPVVAPNYWVRLVNPEGGLDSLSLTVLPGATVTPTAAGIFQLGNLGVFGLKNLRVHAYNTTCEPQHLLVIYGWDCAPYTVPGAFSCGLDTLELLFRPLNPELELDLVDMPAEAPLCDTSGYIVFEVFNADLGYAYRPVVLIELPPGFQLVPGSCQLAYPADQNYVPVADPTPGAGNALEWNLAALQASVGANGLPGVNLEPKNAIRIRFRVLADCGVVSNAQLIFGARAEWSCGKPTNALRKASPPLRVEGVVPAYGVQVGINEVGTGGPLACGTRRTLAVNLLLSGSALPEDSIYVTLPPGFTYVSGSYVPGTNAVSAQPYIAGNVLRWALPAGLPANSAVQFTFGVESGDQPNCFGALVQVQTRQRTAAFCPTINDFCGVYAATGQAFHSFDPADPELAVTGFNLSAGTGDLLNLQLEFENNSTFPVPGVHFQLYQDTDGDGLLSTADVLLFEGTSPGPIPPGGSLPGAWPDAFAGQDICRFLLVLPAAANCDCQEQVFPFTNNQTFTAAHTICLGQSVALGLAGESGHTYEWSGPDDLPCTDCPQFLFEPGSAGLYELSLIDNGPLCSTTHLYSVTVDTAPVLLSPDTIVCQGTPVLLSTSPATGWQWVGPGISTPGAPTQTVMPAQTATYAVTVTSAAGCSRAATVTVTVLPGDTTNLGALYTCEGTPVDVFGTLTDQPGIYTRQLSNVNGCDSILVLELKVRPNTEETLPHCVGTPVLVFGEPVTEAGNYCRTYTSSLGCDSTHCIVVTDLPRPDLPDPDTFYIIAGSSVVLPGPDGFTAYLWAPADSLSCTDCQSPTASPSDTMEYTLVVWTDDGCTDTLIYRVVPYPPCDPLRIRVPNVFTPDGDGVNDVFKALPYEGAEVIQRLTIYNRWGQKLYEDSGPNAAWDGTSDGKPAPSDVYVWILEVLCDGERGKPRHGDITVLR